MRPEPRDLWVVASKRRDAAYLLSNGTVAYVTYHARGRQGSTKVHGPFPADEVAEKEWHWFDVPTAYRGPLRGLSKEELAARRKET